MPTIINGDGVVTAGGTASTQGKVVLAEQTGSGTNTVTIQAPATLAADLTFTMPTADGTNGQVLQTNGSGQLSFATVTTSPAGSTGQVQINNAGAFGAVSSGTNGQYLTSGGAGNPPTWTTPSSGAMILISSASISSGATQAVVTGVDFTTYRFYIIELMAATFSASYGVRVQLSNDGGSTWSTSTGYNYNYMVSSSSVSNSASTVGTDYWQLSNNTTTTGPLNATVKLFAPLSQSPAAMWWTRLSISSGLSEIPVYGTGNNIILSSYNAVRLYPQSGTFTGGTIRVYGVV